MKITADNVNKHYSNYIKYLIKNNKLDTSLLCSYELSFIKTKIKLVNANNKNNILIDFLDKSFTNRIKKMNRKNEIFYKIFKKNKANILDCTGGFGKDSFILHSMGHSVTMIEKNPIVTILLKNALERFKISKFSNNKLSLFHGDAYDYLYNTDQDFDYIYIDFMFDKSKEKLSSKNIETLKILTNNYNKKDELIRLAINKVKDRIVIKNYKKNLPLYVGKSDYTIFTKLLRYDMYLNRQDVK
ncbi:MAG: hypothetical protein CMD65_01875 [Gammaproteobacteria bacterium]|nr:hypothetical protein [Gammaproteobacteria bacterium]|tara:strand:+ start:165 stop:893 length:729 start_codon:yes stop_codon:yes gene_type:complete